MRTLYNTFVRMSTIFYQVFKFAFLEVDSLKLKGNIYN